MSKKVSKKPVETVEEIVEKEDGNAFVCTKEPGPSFRIQQGDRVVASVIADGHSHLVQFYNSRGERKLLSESEFNKYFKKA